MACLSCQPHACQNQCHWSPSKWQPTGWSQEVRIQAGVPFHWKRKPVQTPHFSTLAQGSYLCSGWGTIRAQADDASRVSLEVEVPQASTNVNCSWRISYMLTCFIFLEKTSRECLRFNLWQRICSRTLQKFWSSWLVSSMEPKLHASWIRLFTHNLKIIQNCTMFMVCWCSMIFLIRIPPSNTGRHLFRVCSCIVTRKTRFCHFLWRTPFEIQLPSKNTFWRPKFCDILCLWRIIILLTRYLYCRRGTLLWHLSILATHDWTAQ